MKYDKELEGAARARATLRHCGYAQDAEDVLKMERVVKGLRRDLALTLSDAQWTCFALICASLTIAIPPGVFPLPIRLVGGVVSMVTALHMWGLSKRAADASATDNR